MNALQIKVFATSILFALAITNHHGFSQTVSPKRGFCGNPMNPDDLAAVANISWFYNWGPEPAALIQDTLEYYLDYCPMIWGKDHDEIALRTYLSAHPEIKYLLGFNEPNFIEQANIGPREAAALWPDIEKIFTDMHSKIAHRSLWG